MEKAASHQPGTTTDAARRRGKEKQSNKELMYFF